MERTHRGTVITRGGAAALIGLVAALPLRAQTASPPPVTRHDTTVFFRLAAPSKAMMDSIATLLRALEAEPIGSPAAQALRQQFEALLPSQSTVIVNRRRGGGPPPSLPQGWLGFTAQGPKSQTLSPDGDLLIQYFDYPAIIAVDPESPAQRAGIEAGDVLVAYDRVDVRGHEFNLSQLLVPDRKISVTVRRGDETKDYSLTAAKAPVRIVMRREPDFTGKARMKALIRPDDSPGQSSAHDRTMVPGAPFGGRIMFNPGSVLFSPNGAFGAILSTVSPELARTLKLEPGVLVNDVTDDTPASRAGLHAGDVIVSVSGQTVGSLKALQEIVRTHIAEQTVALKVLRDRKARAVTVSW